MTMTEGVRVAIMKWDGTFEGSNRAIMRYIKAVSMANENSGLMWDAIWRQNSYSAGTKENIN